MMQRGGWRMSDWHPGDLARCVDTDDIRLPLRRHVAQGGRYLVKGMVYIVHSVEVLYETEPALDVGAEYGIKLARRFVKVPPLEEAEAREARRELVVGA